MSYDRFYEGPSIISSENTENVGKNYFNKLLELNFHKMGGIFDALLHYENMTFVIIKWGSNESYRCLSETKELRTRSSLAPRWVS